MPFLQLHLLAVGCWFGVIAAETVLELSGRDEAARRTVAAVHRWIDVWFEIPIVAAVVTTGALLLARAWPASPMLLLKVGAGLVAVTANLVCFPLVQARSRETEDARIRVLARYVRMTGLGIPFAILALLMGLRLVPDQ